MKLVFGAVAAGVTVAAGLAFGLHAAQPQDSYRSPESTVIAGYEGWWNATPAEGSAAGLPQETVAVSTRTGKIVDAFNRSRNDARQVTLPTDVKYDVVPDPSWPKDSVVIIDTSSGKVIESFPVNDRGEPIR
ncbi:hypothetical protein [Arthrobacter sp. GMC3]|uniref:hypothetical protein n=1 Tax=Arthrobacter sp. GMC3 TaxID=2058894 RepID=UPI000CE35E0B|nr:hypothetical protein [Arthrobacter sp. GMC3]